MTLARYPNYVSAAKPKDTAETKLPRLIVIVVFVYFILSGVTFMTDPSGGGGGPLGRLTPADFMMFILAPLTLTYMKRIHFANAYFNILPFFILAGITALQSLIPEKAMVELFVHLWGWCGSLVLYNLMALRPSTSASPILEAFLYSTTILAILGLIQFFWLQNLFLGRTIGGVVGTFRNTGQFGSYMGVGLAIIIPGLISGLIKPTKLKWALTFIIILSLIFSTKRAALIGFIVGYVGLLFTLLMFGNTQRKILAFNILLFSIPVVAIAYLGTEWAKHNLASVEWRLNKKINTNMFEKLFDGFFRENIDAAFTAFGDKPVLGVGMGNVSKIYTAKYEIHSTYLKVLATGGVLGSAAYIYFMFSWASKIAKEFLNSSKESNFLLYFFPFLVGLAISWTYTYHLRKREFWICFAIVVFISRIAYIKRKNFTPQHN